MSKKVLTSIGLVSLAFLFRLTGYGLSQRPLRDVSSRELVERLYVDDLARGARQEIRRRMTEVAIKGIAEDRELVEALLETLDSKKLNVKLEAVITLSAVPDQAVRRKLLGLLNSESDSRIWTALVTVIAYRQGRWPTQDRDIDNIKSVILKPGQSIDGDFGLKDMAILALGTLGAVTALEEVQQHERIRQAHGRALEDALSRARKMKRRMPDE